MPDLLVGQPRAQRKRGVGGSRRGRRQTGLIPPKHYDGIAVHGDDVAVSLGDGAEDQAEIAAENFAQPLRAHRPHCGVAIRQPGRVDDIEVKEGAVDLVAVRGVAQRVRTQQPRGVRLQRLGRFDDSGGVMARTHAQSYSASAQNSKVTIPAPTYPGLAKRLQYGPNLIHSLPIMATPQLYRFQYLTRACPHLSQAIAHTSCNPAEKLRAVSS